MKTLSEEGLRRLMHLNTTMPGEIGTRGERSMYGLCEEGFMKFSSRLPRAYRVDVDDFLLHMQTSKNPQGYLSNLNLEKDLVELLDLEKVEVGNGIHLYLPIEQTQKIPSQELSQPQINDWRVLQKLGYYQN